MPIVTKHALENRNYVYNPGTLSWERMTGSSSGTGTDVNIVSDGVGLARQNQLPASLGQKTKAQSLAVTIASDQTDTPYATKITESGSYTYIAKAAVGSAQSSAVWQAFRVDESSGLVILWADGNSNFDNTATDLTTLTYS